MPEVYLEALVAMENSLEKLGRYKMGQERKSFVMFYPYSSVSQTYPFLFLAITHPSHIIGLSASLVFIIASFHLLPWTSMTHSCLLICTSL